MVILFFSIIEVSGIYIDIASFKNRLHILSTYINYDQSTHFKSCSIYQQWYFFRQIIGKKNSIGKIWTHLGNIQYKEYKIEQKRSHDVWLETVKWEL